MGQHLPVAYVVNGSVRSDEGRARVSAELFDAKSGQVLWSETYDRPLTPDNLLDVQGDLAAQIATRLGQPYGIVRSSIAERFSKNRPRTMAAYGCVLQAYIYRRTFARELYAPARACLEKAIRLDPELRRCLGAVGMGPPRCRTLSAIVARERSGKRDGSGAAAAERAVELAPQKSLMPCRPCRQSAIIAARMTRRKEFSGRRWR